MTVPAGAYSPARKAKKTGNVAFDASLAATQAQADVAGEDFQRDVGERLGGLNAIGALRSGGSAVATREAADTYGKRVSQAAAGNALQFAEMDQRRQLEMEAAEKFNRLFAADTDWRAKEFEEDKRRFDLEYGEGVRRYDTSFGEDTRRFDVDVDYRSGRASRSDYESDRGFGEDTRRFDQEFGRRTFESDRNFGEDTRRYDQGFGRQSFESDRDYQERLSQYEEDKRRYEQERADAKAAEKKKKKRSIWGAIGTIGGGIIGGIVGGPAGAATGAKIGGSVGGS